MSVMRNLVGEGVDQKTLRNLRQLIDHHPSVQSVGKVLTMQLGPEEVLLVADVSFKPQLGADQLATVVGEIERTFQNRYPSIKRLYFEAELLASGTSGKRAAQSLFKATWGKRSPSQSLLMPLWLSSGLWGLLGGSALLLGAGFGYFADVRQRTIAGIMAFGSGVLISALTFDLMDEAFKRGGFDAAAIGFLSGAIVYTGANWVLARHGARHRKRSGKQQPSESEQSGSGLAIAVGALLDGIPESIAIGVSMIAGGAVSMVTVAAVFLSNVPEGLSSSAGMKNAHRTKAYIFGVWTSIAVISGISSLIGYAVFRHFSANVIAATIAVAAGAILSMIVDTMIPEAFQETHDFAGLITVVGFLIAFILSKLNS